MRSTLWRMIAEYLQIYETDQPVVGAGYPTKTLNLVVAGHGMSKKTSLLEAANITTSFQLQHVISKSNEGLPRLQSWLPLTWYFVNRTEASKIKRSTTTDQQLRYLPCCTISRLSSLPLGTVPICRRRNRPSPQLRR